MFQFITIVTTIIGIFTLLDLFIEKNAKAKVAEFVFGFGEINFAGFESNAIKALLSPLKKNDRLSYKHILFRYSSLIAVIFSIVSLLVFILLNLGTDNIDWRDNSFEDFIEFLICIPVFTLLFGRLIVGR